MQNASKYILFCAGEDSGDCIGAPLVCFLQNYFSQKILAIGAGGVRMQAAGLKSIVNFENLPVSGFGDILPKYFKLRSCFAVLKKALESPFCIGFIAIDYPGFNMKLVNLAKKLQKHSLYFAPPQVWAWKPSRAKILAKNLMVQLAVFFDFEKDAYKSYGCNVSVVRHPFVDTVLSQNNYALKSNDNLLLLPGSRIAQMQRNIPLFLLVALQFAKSFCNTKILIVAARAELKVHIHNAVTKFFHGALPKNIDIVVAPQNSIERLNLFSFASVALCAPGTITLELALSKTPMVICTKPDKLTYIIAKIFIKSKMFALPNIILNSYSKNNVNYFAEHIVCFINKRIILRIVNSLKSALNSKNTEYIYKKLLTKLSATKQSNVLMSEFFAKLV